MDGLSSSAFQPGRNIRRGSFSEERMPGKESSVRAHQGRSALRRWMSSGLLLGAVLSLLAMAAPHSLSAPLLRQQIDQAIAARAGGPLAARSSDAEFLRRVFLD